MSGRETAYLVGWETGRSWLTACRSSVVKAHCTVCRTDFKIGRMGVSAVNSHAKGPTHLAKLKRQNEEPTQSKIILGATGKVAVASSSLGKKIAAEEIPEELYALRAEVYETLHKVEYNASFHSAQDDAKRFQLMFPGNNVAEQYACGATKATYLLTHGVSPYLKMRMIEDCANVPFTIKFDETTTSQVKKQFDMYICYWSPRHDEVVIAGQESKIAEQIIGNTHLVFNYHISMN